MSFSNIKEVTENFQLTLKRIYNPEEIRNFTRFIFEHLLGFSKTDMLLNKEQKLNIVQIDFCKNALKQLEKQVPIQYIIGNSEFLGLKLTVDNNVLIPRQETEELVDWVIQTNQLKEPKILDIGTGSGCIPISLKKNIPNAEVSAWDISDGALIVAKHNAELNQVEINFTKQNALKPDLLDTPKLDIIVSNPPYVRNQEKELMHKNVLDNEPHLALFVGDDDPLVFYRSIANSAMKLLNDNGFLFFEINEAFGKQTCELLEDLGFTRVELRKDLFNKDRMIRAQI